MYCLGKKAVLEFHNMHKKVKKTFNESHKKFKNISMQKIGSQS